MICNNCKNQKKFQAVVTYYEPVEIWEFNDDGSMARFNQPETGDLDIKLSCPVCNSDDIDSQEYNIQSFVENPLTRLDGEGWDKKIKECESN